MLATVTTRIPHRLLGLALVLAGLVAAATKPVQAAPPTYAGEVAAILQKNCQGCHRPGHVGPFSLETYAQARKRADDIATVVRERRMPPWKAAPQVYPKFYHDRSMSEADIKTVVTWAEAGAPEGDRTQMPTPPEYPGEWRLGTPDLVLEMPVDFAVPASGEDVYRCFVFPTNLPDDRYIAALEYRPGNRRVVHHIQGYVDNLGLGRKRDESEAGVGYASYSGAGVKTLCDLASWVPGDEARFLPEGVGRSLPRGSDIILQVHYHPTGKPETDRSRIGLYFSKTPIKQTLHRTGAFQPNLKIPAGDPNFEARASWILPVDMEALFVQPHMHSLGHDMRMWATLPGGRELDLIQIDDWDFAWQSYYYFEQPITLPKGTVVKVVAHFDNSANNPRNPNNPPKPVQWGWASYDEMCVGFIGVTKKGQDLTQPDEKDDLSQIIDQNRDDLRELRKRVAKDPDKAPLD